MTDKIMETVQQHEILSRDYRKMAEYSQNPREKAYILRQATQAEQVARWLREYLALREQVRKEVKE